MDARPIRVLDLGLTNSELYDGLSVEVLAGNVTLVTEPEQAIPVMTQNLAKVSIDTS